MLTFTPIIVLIRACEWSVLRNNNDKNWWRHEKGGLISFVWIRLECFQEREAFELDETGVGFGWE